MQGPGRQKQNESNSIPFIHSFLLNAITNKRTKTVEGLLTDEHLLYVLSGRNLQGLTSESRARYTRLVDELRHSCLEKMKAAEERGYYVGFQQYVPPKKGNISNAEFYRIFLRIKQIKRLTDSIVRLRQSQIQEWLVQYKKLGEGDIHSRDLMEWKNMISNVCDPYQKAQENIIAIMREKEVFEKEIEEIVTVHTPGAEREREEKKEALPDFHLYLEGCTATEPSIVHFILNEMRCCLAEQNASSVSQLSDILRSVLYYSGEKKLSIVDVPDAKQKTPLLMAILGEFPPTVVKILLEYGANSFYCLRGEHAIFRTAIEQAISHLDSPLAQRNIFYERLFLLFLYAQGSIDAEAIRNLNTQMTSEFRFCISFRDFVKEKIESMGHPQAQELFARSDSFYWLRAAVGFCEVACEHWQSRNQSVVLRAPKKPLFPFSFFYKKQERGAPEEIAGLLNGGSKGNKNIQFS